MRPIGQRHRLLNEHLLIGPDGNHRIAVPQKARSVIPVVTAPDSDSETARTLIGACDGEREIDAVVARALDRQRWLDPGIAGRRSVRGQIGAGRPSVWYRPVLIGTTRSNGKDCGCG